MTRPSRHSAEFQRDAVALVRSSPDRTIAQIATELGVSFFSNFKLETLYDLETRRFDDAGHARREIFRWIAWYNHRRRHSRAHYLSPVDYENRHRQSFTSADDSDTLISIAA
jgi:transposase InsO family protein